MASTTQFKEERAKAAAKLAAKDLEDVKRERVCQDGANFGTNHQYHHKEQRPGVIGSVIRAVHDTYEHAKEAVIGKTHDENDTAAHKDYTTEKAKDTTDRAPSKMNQYTDYAAEKANETKDATRREAGEYRGYAAQKANETKEATKQKAGEYTDYAAQKAKETKETTKQKAGDHEDYAAEKAKEAKDTTMEKAEEYKDYTAEKAKEGKDATIGKLGEAMGYLTGKKEETKQRIAETAEAAKQRAAETKDWAKERASQAEEETKRRMEKMKNMEGKEYRNEPGGRADEYKDEEQRGTAGKGTILGAMGSAGEAIKSKLTMPSDVVEETRAARARGGTGRRHDDKVAINVEETRPGAAAATLKAADQMTGQTFNDVGSLDDEGNVVCEASRRDKI